MLFIKTSFHKVSALFIIFLISLNFNSVWANNFISRGHYVIDLSQKIEWLTCPVGMVWQNKTCVGNPVKLKFNEINSVILQANEQLKGQWRLPKREELEKIICMECKKVKINKEIFPNTPPESAKILCRVQIQIEVKLAHHHHQLLLHCYHLFSL